MLKNLIGAFIIFRLELRQLPIDPGLVVALWRHRTAIAVVIDHGAECRQQSRLVQQLNEVYPF